MRRSIVHRLEEVAQKPAESATCLGVDETEWPLVVVDVGRRLAHSEMRARLLERLVRLRAAGTYALVLDCHASPLLEGVARHAFVTALAADELRFPGTLAGLALVAVDPAQQRALLALSWLLAGSGIDVASFDKVADARTWASWRVSRQGSPDAR